jgi:DNA-binding CsgD family transcriptional regulator/tetratricopeptide (TPR) repeat protein
VTTYVCPLLVGRVDERAELTAALRERKAVLVSGPAGVGKSALVRDVLDSRTSVSGRATPSSTLRPYRPIVDAVLRARRAGRDHLPPALTELTDPSPNEVDPLHLADALVEWVGADVLVLEDLHWADSRTLEVVEQLADAGGLAVLTTAREQLSVIRGIDVVPLGPLSDVVVHEIASRCLGGALTARLATAIARGAEGLPFLVEELLAALSTRLQNTPDGWDLLGDDPVIPRRLDDHDRRVLSAAAVIGRRFDWEVAAAAAGTEAPAALAALRRAADLQLLDPDPDRAGALRFRHALTRDAVDALTFPPDRAELASRALDVMLARDAALGGDDVLTAAELARAAGRGETAAPLLITAATEAFNRHALDAAEQLLEDAAALSSPDDAVHLKALHERLRVLSGMGRLQDVEELGQRLLQALPADDPAMLVEVRLRLARAAQERREPAVALDHLAIARTLLDPPNGQPCHPARIDLEEALAQITAGRLDDAVAAAQRSIAQTFPDDPDRSQDDFADVESFALLAWARAIRRRDPAEARRLLDRAERVMAGLPQALMVARIDVERAALDLDAGNADPPDLDRAERAARLAGGRGLVARIEILRGLAALLRFDDAAVSRHADAAEQLALRHSLPVVAREAALLRACIAALRGVSSLPEVEHLAELARGGAGDAAVVLDLPYGDVLAPFAALSERRPTAAPWVQHQQARLHSDDRTALTDAAAWFEEHDLVAAAEATRERLREQGIPFPRRRSALADVPANLQARGVTTRELEVLNLVAQGLSNREVAETLVLSVRTVDKHVEHLLAKTGCANRTALAQFAQTATTQPATT